MIITAPARCGTTLLAHAFFRAGWAMGDVDPPENIGKDGRPVGGGMEHKTFVDVNERLLGALAEGTPPEEIAARFAGSLEFPADTAVMKDPRYLVTFPVWAAAGRHPARVVLCLRNWSAHRRSYRVSHRTWPFRELLEDPVAIANLIVYTQQHDVPLSLVLFPRVGEDRAYAERVLGGLLEDPWTSIRALWQPDMVHYR